VNFCALFLVLISLPLRARAAPHPWWDDYPTMAQAETLAEVKRSGAASVIHGAAADPTWGIMAAKLRAYQGAANLRALHADGRRAITWVEAFGDCMSYVAALGLSADGTVQRDPNHPDVPNIILNNWAWQFSGSLGPHQTVWIGLHNYTDDLPWARPYTRANPRYGMPMPRFPNGVPAIGCNGSPANPTSWRVYQAGASRDINGKLGVVWELNPEVNRLDPGTGSVAGPTEGLVPVVAGRDETSDPALKPGEVRYAGIASVHKDAACPFWPAYFAASCRNAVDAGLDGLWCDNYSAWDNFGYPPVERAFGEWSVARFRQYLARHFSPAQLRAMGVENPAVFDVRAELKARFRRWFGEDPSNLRAAGWRDARWLSDPIWRAYRTFKQQAGAEALRRCYAAAKRAGGSSFAVTGNDIPWFSLGWVTDHWLDMVNTELNPGWHPGSGSFGVGFPPVGRMSPVYRLAAAHGKGRFAVAWYYLDGQYAKYRGNSEVGRVLSYEALACNTFLLSYPSNPSISGTPQSHHEVNSFVTASKPLWGDRKPAANLAVLFSPTSQLAFMAPGGYPNMDRQPHVFSFYGWCTALEMLHVPYLVLPEFKVTPAALSNVDLLIAPEVVALPAAARAAISAWVRRGGLLLVDEPASSLGCPPPFRGLEPLRGVWRLRGERALDFYVNRDSRAQQLRWFAGVVAAAKRRGFRPTAEAASMPPNVGLTVFANPSQRALSVDCYNVDLSPAGHRVVPAEQLRMTLRLPAYLAGKRLRGLLLMPGQTPSPIQLVPNAKARTVGIHLPGLRYYASVLVMLADKPASVSKPAAFAGARYGKHSHLKRGEASRNSHAPPSSPLTASGRGVAKPR